MGIDGSHHRVLAKNTRSIRRSNTTVGPKPNSFITTVLPPNLTPSNPAKPRTTFRPPAGTSISTFTVPNRSRFRLDNSSFPSNLRQIRAKAPRACATFCHQPAKNLSNCATICHQNDNSPIQPVAQSVPRNPVLKNPCGTNCPQNHGLQKAGGTIRPQNDDFSKTLWHNLSPKRQFSKFLWHNLSPKRKPLTALWHNTSLTAPENNRIVFTHWVENNLQGAVGTALLMGLQER